MEIPILDRKVGLRGANSDGMMGWERTPGLRGATSSGGMMG